MRGSSGSCEHEANSGISLTPEELFHGHVLGLVGKITFEDVKRHYRSRIVEYHPDKVAYLGSKLRELAEEETKRINAAYDFFRVKYARTV